ncbi:MAG TPA: phage tail tape measure protein [Pseudolabrys sp.]|jgi:lambda family phage tail tape measure protein|nr:phage tail tape measure protein [Pseudolabrys sp.]
MSDSYDFSSTDTSASGDFVQTADTVRSSTNALGVSATAFASAMTKAFSQATTGGKQLDDVLKSLALRLSNMATAQALKPALKGAVSGIGGMFGGSSSGGGAASDVMNLMSAVQPFAAGGVIGAPTYFPMASGGVGLAGEAGPEAIVPLTRGSDGRLGISMAGSSAPNITVQIATPDASSFRRSETYVTGQIARAVARGQRGM